MLLTAAPQYRLFRRHFHHLLLHTNRRRIAIFIFAHHFAQECDVADGQFEDVDFAEFLLVR